jgi:hypothetical protein
MPYPQFPSGGVSDKPLWFSTFDPTFMAQAIGVFTASGGGGAIYNPFGGTPPGFWVPGFVMFENAGNIALAAPVVWGGWKGPRPVMWLTDAGGWVD